MADDNTISIKVTADAAGVTSGLSTATNEVTSFGDEVNNLAQRVQAIKPDAFKELATALNAGKVDLDEFRDGLIALSSTQAAAATAATELAEKTALNSSALRELTVVGRELASGNLTRLPGSLSILATRLGGISPAAILATGAIAAVGYALYEVIDASERADANLAKIQNAFTAVGSGNQFDGTQVTQYIDDLRQIPGVTDDAATSIVNEFARAENGTRLLGETTKDLKPLADALEVEVPQAAKLLSSALNDPAKAIQTLRQYGIQLSASQQEQITSMMAVNDVAGAQRVLLDALADAASHATDSSTLLAHLGQDIGNSLSGVDENVGRTANALDGLARALTSIGSTGSAAALGLSAMSAASRQLGNRNLPNAGWSGSAGSMASGDARQAAQDQAEQARRDNDSVVALDKMNSSLREQEQHRANIAKIQEGINAAERLGDDHGVRQGYSALETENKNYYGNSAPSQDSGDNRYALSEAKGDAAAADARIKTEQEVVSEKQRLGEISTAESVKQLQALASQEHEINLKRIADMRAVYAQQGDKAGMARSDSDAGVENERYKQQSSQIDAQGAESTRQAQQAEMDGDRRVADAKVQTAQLANQEKVALGQMSARQEIQAEIDAANQKNAIDQQYYNGLLAKESQDSAQYQKTLADKLIAEEKFNQQVLQLRTRLAQQEQQQDNQLTKSITNGLNQTVNGVLTGTQTMTQAFERMGQNIVLSVVEGALDKIVTKFLTNNATIEAAQQALNSFLGISNEENAVSAQLSASTSAATIIPTYAAEGAAAAIASTSAIPLVGPELAPAAGAGIYAEIMAFEVASAAGGMIVPNDQLAMVHENEMVLPARYTSGLTNMIDQANAGGGGGGHTFNNTFNLSGVQARDIPKMIDSHIQKQARNGAYGGMKTA